MPLIIDFRLGSHDFDTGPQAGSGSILLYVLGAASQDEALDAVLSPTYLPESVNGYLRGKIGVKHQGGDLYFIDADYQRGIPDKASPDAGQSPPGQQTPGKDPNSPLSRNVSFSTGGGTRKIYKSIRTVAGYGRNYGTAPNFGKLIGVDIDGGKVEGCEVLTAEADFTIEKRFPLLTVGWFRCMLTLVASTNDAPYLGLDIGEVLFKGCDGQFKDDDKQGYPWTVTARFGFKPNKTIDANPDELTLGPDDDETKQIRITSVRGHQYVWAIYQKETQNVTIGGVATPYIVQRPLFAYVEVVYPEMDLTQLDLTTLDV